MPRIFVIDDSSFSRRQIGDILRAAGFDVTTEADGFVGLKRVAREQPDCVIVDLLLPAINARTFLHKLRQAGYDTPVIITGVENESLTERECELVGAAAFVVKPIQADQLIDQVERALSGLESLDGELRLTR